MLRFRAGGVEFRLHALTLVMAALMCVMGDTLELISVLAALCVHEAAHMVAARCCGLKIEHIDIMPFGGAARIVGLNSAPAWKTAIVALAGPAANAVMAAFGGALGWLGALDFLAAASVMRVNIVLMLFNLLPALPLDGGRALMGLGGMLIGRRNSARLFTGMAHLIAVALVGIAVYGYFIWGIFNITYAIVAVFLIAGSLDDMKAVFMGDADAAVRSLMDEKKLPKRARLVAIDKETPYAAASAHINPEDLTIFAVIGDDDIRLVSEREIAKLAIQTQSP